MSAIDRPLVEDARAVLARHARSFRWATPFLGTAARDDAAVAYALCRLIDDVADEHDDTPAARAHAAFELHALRAELQGVAPARPLVAAFLDLQQRRGIDPGAMTDLIAGALSDLALRDVRDEAELDLYAYRVAGTVGLMMCGILEASGPAARAPAVALGVGMQLTNIARDVAEDARRGRVYLPATWLNDAGVRPDDVRAQRDPQRVFAVVRRLLARAEASYAAADCGLSALPWRARLAVLVAGRLYRAIGAEVLRLGVAALRTRAYVPWHRKVALAVGAVASALTSRPSVVGALSASTSPAPTTHASG